MTTNINLLDNPKGYLFLDVDGVINPLWAKARGPGWTVARIGNYDVWVIEPLSIWLSQLLADGIQIVWATTWVTDEAMLTELATRWSLPTDLPRIDGMSRTYRDSGKQPGVERWLAAHNVDTSVTPAVWVDDMLGPGDISWALAKGVTPLPVNPYLGLTEDEARAAVEVHLCAVTA